MYVGLPDTDEGKDDAGRTTQEYMPGAIVCYSVPKESATEEPKYLCRVDLLIVV